VGKRPGDVLRTRAVVCDGACLRSLRPAAVGGSFGSRFDPLRGVSTQATKPLKANVRNRR
jgi:hypothetical protein